MFIYSLPIFFNNMGMATPLELLIIFLAVFALLFITAPQSETNFQNPLADNYLSAAWSGRIALTWAFWPFFLLLNVGLYTIDTLAKSGLFTVSSWDDIHFILILPTVWWTTAVWRCSANSQSRVWASLARLINLSVFFEYGLKLLIRIDYPRIFFNCEELLLDYGSCF